MAEEVFGPVEEVSQFTDLGSAIQMANDSPYGFRASVYPQNISSALPIAHRLEAGGEVINAPGVFRPGNFPFGGFKQSGMGR